MGLITEIDFNKVAVIAEKHGITPKQCYEIWHDVHLISEQVLTENVPLLKLKELHSDIGAFITGVEAIKNKQDQ